MLIQWTNLFERTSRSACPTENSGNFKKSIIFVATSSFTFGNGVHALPCVSADEKGIP
jgi:hypothetical protein